MEPIKVYFHVHKGLPLVRTFSQMYPVHAIHLICLKVYFAVILPYVRRYSKRFFTLYFPTETLYVFVMNPSCTIQPTSLRWSPNNSWQEVHIMKLHSAFSEPCLFLYFSSICSPQHPILIHLHSVPNLMLRDPGFEPIWNSEQSHRLLYFSSYIFR